jgi:hypothetical protein
VKKNYLFFFSFVSFFLIFSLFSKINAKWVVDTSGFLYHENGEVLGKNDRITLPGKSGQTPAASRKANTTPLSDSVTSDEATPTPIEVSPTPERRIPPGIQKILLEGKNEKLQIKFMDQSGQQVDEPPIGTDSSQLDIEDPDEQNVTTIKATQNASLVIRNKIIAQTRFPLMVDLNTNALIVTTPKGQKIVTILPDAAVQHMLAANVLDQAGGKGGLLWMEYQNRMLTLTPAPTSMTPEPSGTLTPDPSGSITPEASGSPTPETEMSGTPTPEPSGTITIEPTTTGEPDTTPTEEVLTPTPTIEALPQADTGITLTSDKDGILVYEIEGVKNKKFLGFFPVKLNRIAVVSAETGELLSIREDFPTRFLDTLSF